GKPPVLAATAQGPHAGGGGRRSRKRGVPAAKPGYRGSLEAGRSRLRVPRGTRRQPLHGGGRADEACERTLRQGRRARSDVTRHGQSESADARIARDRQHGGGVYGALREGPARQARCRRRTYAPTRTALPIESRAGVPPLPLVAPAKPQ